MEDNIFAYFENNPNMSIFLAFAILLVVALALVHLYFVSRESYKLAIQFPGPKPIPLLGNALLAVGLSNNGRSTSLRDSFAACGISDCKFLPLQRYLSVRLSSGSFTATSVAGFSATK